MRESVCSLQNEMKKSEGRGFVEGRDNHRSSDLSLSHARAHTHRKWRQVTSLSVSTKVQAHYQLSPGDVRTQCVTPKTTAI